MTVELIKQFKAKIDDYLEKYGVKEEVENIVTQFITNGEVRGKK